MINKSQLAAKFLKENEGKYSKKKAGEILHYKYPDLFKDSEDARKIIRYVTGNNGIKARIKISKDTKIEWKGLTLPKPDKNDYSKVVIKEKRIAILSDIHIPYYDEQALNATLFYLIDWKPDCILLNGDIIDCYHLSNFEKDKRARSFKYELDVLRNFFVELRSLFPKARIIYKIGNHEERYEKQLLQRLPELIELEYFHFENVIEANKYNISVVANKRMIRAGHLNIAHGHEFAKGFIMPVNVARGFYLKAKSNIIAGHHHRISEHTETDINGKTIGAWSTGCLCELNPRYMPINNWNHGFATVEIINSDGDFRVKNHKIINGEVV